MPSYLFRHGVFAVPLCCGAQVCAHEAGAATPQVQQSVQQTVPHDLQPGVANFDAAGYRSARYRAPVDRDPAPARRIAQDRALHLAPGQDALFIDVLPVESGWRDPQSGIWQLAAPHASIPGALWHPETGRSAPDPRLWAALREAVASARTRHPDWPVVLFCRADCWMGWNAARRLASEGVKQVYWYGEGIDGWHAAGHPLTPVSPVRVRPQDAAGASGQ